MNDVMPGSDELRILGFEKKQKLRFDARRSKSIFRACRGQTSSLQWVLHVVRVRWKIQHRKKLCLSLLMLENLKLKKVIKSFVLEPISCFSDSCIHFTYSYLGRIFLDVYVLQNQFMVMILWKWRMSTSEFNILKAAVEASVCIWAKSKMTNFCELKKSRCHDLRKLVN